MEDTIGVDNYMGKVSEAIKKHLPWPSDEFTEIYNRAWEAVAKAIKDASQPTREVLNMKDALEFIAHYALARDSNVYCEHIGLIAKGALEKTASQPDNAADAKKPCRYCEINYQNKFCSNCGRNLR